ncbi:MAG TPA: DoxX family membrane protein, partial [Candidatus Limnocylindria bacterium]|nr:DoxX family membrane protein [Candidatus Limnocylindria bacterium]
LAMQVVDRRHQLGVAVLRVGVGIIFLWAGLEKVIGGAGGWSAAGFLGFGTGGTLGWPFVAEAVEGVIYNPTHDMWVVVSENSTAMTIINLLVPWGQVGIGVSLILGLLTRFGAAMGTLMMLIFFVAAWDFQFGVVNQHLTYALVTFFIGYIGAGNFYGLDATVGQRVSPTLRRWLFSGELYRPVETSATPAMA